MLTNDQIAQTEILLKAQILFLQYGMKKTTMDEIARACGKAKSTIYHHFKNKEDVFESVIDMELLNLRVLVKDKVEEHKTLVEKIHTYFTTFHYEIYNKINLYRVMAQEQLPENISDRVYSKVIDFEKSYIIRILEDGYDSGEFRKFKREEIPWIAEMFFAAFFGIVRYFIKKDGAFSFDRLQKTADTFIPHIFS
jgi:AcrR family transcriptional regulator